MQSLVGCESIAFIGLEHVGAHNQKMMDVQYIDVLRASSRNRDYWLKKRVRISS